MFAISALVLWTSALCVRSARLADYGAFLQTSHPEYFNLTESQGISELCVWLNNPVYMFVCPQETAGNYTVGPANPALCVESMDLLLVSSEFGNVSVSFDKGELESFRSVNVDSPDEYVYALPVSRYAAPNVLYEATELEFFFSGGASSPGSLPTHIYNCFNASAASLRDYYGVDESLQGSEDTIQSSAMYVGLGDESVNASAINEYLDLQGLVPNIPLQFRDWGPKNDVEQCFTPGADCGEQMLDTQTQQAFAPQAITFYMPTADPLNGNIDPSTAITYLTEAGYSESQAEDLYQNFDTNNPDDMTALNAARQQYLLDFFKNLTESELRPQVASLSWSTSGYTSFTSYGVLEESLKKLALDGMTIMVASGDKGGSGDVDGCYNASNPLIGNHEDAGWPIVSPWVTIVGGTQMLATDDNSEGTEVVCSTITKGGITSGGGFAGSIFPANLFGRPAWQEKAVTGYLSNNNASTFAGFPTTKTPGYNPEGRAFPDISMYASWFPILGADGTLGASSGTSLAAPMAAAVFTLANQKLMEDGYGTIGYANPMLYWMGENCTEAFNDITVGDNQANEAGTDCLFGFPAAPGWDAATGFGSINFGPFVECAKRYQDEVRSKGLELLPDGTFNTAAATSSNGGSPSGQAPSPESHGSGRGSTALSSSLVAISIALLLSLN